MPLSFLFLLLIYCVQKFCEYVSVRSSKPQIDRVARLMASAGVDPYVYITEYFCRPSILCESLGLFRRLSNAWTGFWKNPHPEDSPTTRLDTAKKALSDLQQMMQQQGDGHHTETILLGIEQSLSILGKIDPEVRQISRGEVPHSGPDGLPQDLDQKWVQIMTTLDQYQGMPDSDDKTQKIAQANEELNKFWVDLETRYRQLNQNNPGQAEQAGRIRNFMVGVEKNADFRKVKDLLDYAQRRTADGLAVSRPKGYEEVAFVWRKLSGTEDQKKQQLLQWYSGLPQTHPVKAFIRQDMQENPSLGANEQEFFWKYANDWLNKFGHYHGT